VKIQAAMNRHTLDAFCRQYPLTRAAVAQALLLTQAQPHAVEWRGFSALLLQRAGAVVMATGGLMWVVLAWQGLSVLGRFAMLQLGVVVCIGMALWRPAPHWVGLMSLLMSMVLVGGLLFFLNAWHLNRAHSYEWLLVWVLLTLPLVLAGGCAGLWVVWCAGLNMAVVLLLGTVGPAGWGALGQDKGALLMLPCLLNLGAAAAFAGLANTAFRPTKAHGLVRLWAGLGFLYGTVACMVSILASPALALSDSAAAVVVAFSVLWLTMAWATWQQRDDVFAVGLLATSFVAVSSTGVAKALPFEDPSAWGFSWGMGRRLRQRGGRLGGTTRAQGSQPKRRSHRTSRASMKQRLGAHGLWCALQESGQLAAHAAQPEFQSPPLASERAARICQGVSAWCLGLLVAWLLLRWCAPRNSVQAAGLSLGLLGTAWGLLHARRASVFAVQLALALSLLAQLGVGLALTWHPLQNLTHVAIGWGLLQALLLWCMPHSLHRTLAALLAVLAWALAWRWALPLETVWAWSVTWLPVAAGLLALIQHEAAWIARGWTPVMRPLLLGLMWALAWGPLLSQLEWVLPTPWPLFSVAAALISTAAAFSLRDPASVRWSMVATLVQTAHAALGGSASLWIEPWWLVGTGLILMLAGARLASKPMAHNVTTPPNLRWLVLLLGALGVLGSVNAWVADKHRTQQTHQAA
jgi:hypothetical protein